MFSPIQIEGQTFEFMVERRNKTRLYQSADRKKYLRVGHEEAIQQELRFHEQLLERQYPVPVLLGEGRLNTGETYYLEAAVGDEKFGAIFAREFKEGGSITDKTYSQFVQVVGKYLAAQRRTTFAVKNWEAVFIAAHFDMLLDELPGERETILKVWDKIRDDLKDVPFVLCHGDFNAFNILPGGVIDFETPFEGPLGYDLVCAVTTIGWFPQTGDFEVNAAFSYSADQVKRLWALAPDTLKYFDALFLLRASWAAVRMQRFPKLQAWRYARIREAMAQYLQGQSLYDLF